MDDSFKMDKTAFLMGSHEEAAEYQYDQWRSKNASELFDEVQQLISNFNLGPTSIDNTVFSMRKHDN